MLGAPIVTSMRASSPSGTWAPPGTATRTWVPMRWGSSRSSRIAHDRAEALASLEDGGDDLATQRSRHHVLHLAQGHAVLGQAAQVGGDVEVVGAGQAFGERAGRSGHLAHHRFDLRSEEHTSELQSLMRISYAVFCLTKK